MPRKKNKKTPSKIIIDIDDDSDADAESSAEFIECAITDDENPLECWSTASSDMNKIRFGNHHRHDSGPYNNLTEVMMRQDSINSDGELERNRAHGRRSSDDGNESTVLSFPETNKEKYKRGWSGRRRLRAVGQSMSVRLMKKKPAKKKKSSWRNSRIEFAIDDEYDECEVEEDGKEDSNEEGDKEEISEVDKILKKYASKYKDSPTDQKYGESGDYSNEEYSVFRMLKSNEETSLGKKIIYIVTLSLMLLLVIMLGATTRHRKEYHLDENDDDYTPDTPVGHEPPPMTNEKLMELLHPISPSLSESTGWTNLTPQGKALKWIKEHSLSMMTDNIVQRYILATLFYSTNGQKWESSSSSNFDEHWLSTTDECLWVGVSCKNRKVYALDLVAMGLSGTIPHEISKLGNLKTLDLSNNRLGGSIPVAFEEIALLENINLSSNSLNGIIPNGIGNLANLNYINLSNNQLVGEFPNEIVNLKALESLILSNNKVTGKIPRWIDGLDSLKYLQLSGNELLSTIPSEIGNLGNLELLHLDNNPLDGTIPDSIGDLTLLREVIISRTNLLHGPIPDSFSGLTKLEKLHLQDNKLTGQIPGWLENFVMLDELKLEDNELKGGIPSAVCNGQPRVLTSDCGGNIPKVNCSCCTTCYPT